MSFDEAVTAAVALFVTIDPVGSVPLFIALTRTMDVAARRMTAIRACVIAFVILTFFGLFGETMLEAIGISMSAFRIAGGLLLFLIAVEMLFEKRSERRNHRADDPPPDPTVFPLATPLIAGPGALATMILYSSTTEGIAGLVILNLILAAIMALCLGLFLAGSSVARHLSPTGITVFTRLLGILLAALSVQFVIDGLTEVGIIDGT